MKRTNIEAIILYLLLLQSFLHWQIFPPFFQLKAIALICTASRHCSVMTKKEAHFVLVNIG
jgi:hypothetical protein